MSESQYLNSMCITGLAASFAEILGIDPPRKSAAPLEALTGLAEREFNGGKAERMLIFNPDAIALWLFQKYTSKFIDVLANTQLCLPMLSVMPSVTPVCFASMYTGAAPYIHGIQSYAKPVLKTDTLFDAVLRAGKKPAIVSTGNDSVSRIFLEREMDYFIYATHGECNRKAAELIAADEHDLIVVYNGNYDGAMHKHSPEGVESLLALDDNAQAFARLAGIAAEAWKHHNAFIGFAPDHGCHEIDGGLGSHGLSMPEDMNIVHFYGASRAQ